MFANLALYHHIYLLVALWMTGYQVINARTYTGTTERSGTIKGYAQTHHSWPTTSIKHCSSFNCHVNPCLSLQEWAVRWNGSKLVPGSVVDKFDVGDAWTCQRMHEIYLKKILIYYEAYYNSLFLSSHILLIGSKWLIVSIQSRQRLSLANPNRNGNIYSNCWLPNQRETAKG